MKHTEPTTQGQSLPSSRRIRFGAPLRILVATPSDEERRAIGAVLERDLGGADGIVVREASDAERCARLMASDGMDVLIADRELLTHDSGANLAVAAAQLVPVIVLADAVDIDDDEELIRRGADDCVTKNPEGYSRLGRVVRSSLARAASRAAGDALGEGQHRVLEMISTGASLEDVLTTIVLIMESQSAGMLGSILLLEPDGVRVRHGAAPNLPPEYVRLIDGQHIGPSRGSCGTSMHFGKPVIVTDILTDPLWNDYRDAARPFGLRACWSTPIFTRDRRVLGSFAMYYREVRSPTAAELHLTTVATDLAGIAIERSRADEALRASEQRFTRVFQANPASVAILRASDARYLDVNEALERLTGYTRAELIGHTSAELGIVTPASEETGRAALGAVSSLREFETIIRTKSGEQRTLLSSVELAEIGGEDVMVASGIDISSRKRVEEELRASEERFSMAFQANPAIMILLTPEGRYVDVNESFIRTIGYSRDEVFGKGSVELGIVDEGTWHRGRRGLARAVGTFEFELPVRTKSGEERLLLASTVRIEIDERPYLLGSSIDVTARRRVEELTRAALREKELLLSEVQHRVKNNLQVISSLLNLQAQQIPNEAARAALQESRFRVRSMALVHDMLYRSPTFGRIDIADYVRTLAAQLARAYGTDPARVHVHVDAEPVTIGIDTAIPVGLLLNELVSNALKHAFPNPTDAGDIRVSLRRETDGRLVLGVRDTGIGLPSDLDWRHPTSLGLQLVNTLAEQLHASLERVATSRGTALEVDFREPEYTNRT